MTYHAMPKGPFDDPWGASCKSCNMPIWQGEPTEEVRFPAGSQSDGMSGTYHIECARPFASIARALDMLSRGFG